MSTLGIDLGTTNTVAAIDKKVLELAHGTERDFLLPSVVAFLPSGATLVGKSARRRRVIDPKNTIFSAKRLLGRRWHSADTKTFREIYPFDIVETEDGEAAFNTRRGMVSPTEVSSIVLSTLLQRSVEPVEADRIVITVPSMFGESERAATRAAAKAAGLAEVTIVDEPIAAVHAYHNGTKSLGLVTVYDLGGGTFDLAVVDCRKRPFDVLSFKGNLYLGGDDVDLALARWVSHELMKRYSWDISNDQEVFGRLVIECEAAKIALCEATEAVIELGRIDPAAPCVSETVTLTRPRLENLTNGLVQRTFALCDDVLSSLRIKASDIDTVILAGGSTQLPIVRNGVEAYFGKQPLCTLHPMRVVSMGASVVPF